MLIHRHPDLREHPGVLCGHIEALTRIVLQIEEQ